MHLSPEANASGAWKRKRTRRGHFSIVSLGVNICPFCFKHVYYLLRPRPHRGLSRGVESRKVETNNIFQLVQLLIITSYPFPPRRCLAFKPHHHRSTRPSHILAFNSSNRTLSLSISVGWAGQEIPRPSEGCGLGIYGDIRSAEGGR